MCFRRRIHCRCGGGRKETMDGNDCCGRAERSRTEEGPGEEITEEGWVDNREGGCHEKGIRGVGRIEVSETTKMFKNGQDMKLILYKIFGAISFDSVSENFV